MEKFLKKKSEEAKKDAMVEIGLVKEVNSIEELDDFLHQQTIDHMKAIKDGKEEEFQPKKVVLGQKLKDMGIENVHEILMMKSIERAMNDPSLKEKDESGVNHWEEFEKTIYPLLSNGKKVIFH